MVESLNCNNNASQIRPFMAREKKGQMLGVGGQRGGRLKGDICNSAKNKHKVKKRKNKIL